tara:strand:+ start:912 stop:1493 length:582 start_codon:yes stop_codon:yes gene_type:complete
LVVEALTFKLSLDFFVYLKKYKIVVSKIRIGFFDVAENKSTYTDFSSIDEMELFYQTNYVPFDPCFVGDLVSIQVFIGESNLYEFTTEYRAENITKVFKLTSGSSFDIQRNKQREILTNRQIGFINRAVEDYRKFWNEINRIYTTGIYSICYAEPGWSEGTWYLDQLRLAFTEKNDVAEFPYDDVNIIPEPPE